MSFIILLLNIIWVKFANNYPVIESINIWEIQKNIHWKICKFHYCVNKYIVNRIDILFLKIKNGIGKINTRSDNISEKNQQHNQIQ